MARKKRRGVTLFELLKKDDGQRAGMAPKAQPGAAQQQQASPAEPQVPADSVVTVKASAEPAAQPAPITPIAAPQEPAQPVLQSDEEGYILHLSRQQMLGIGAATVVVLVVLVLIGGRMFRSQPAVPPHDADPYVPLPSLKPDPGTDRAVPDSPVLVPRTTEAQKPARNEPAEPEQDIVAEPARPMAAQAVPSAAGNVCRPGMNYLVIQNVAADVKPSPQEHVAGIRKFLDSKGIRSLTVPATDGGFKVISEECYEDKHKFDSLIEKVRQAGKEYASAKYKGPYNFASPYVWKCPDKQ